MKQPDNLDRVAALAEHLDSLGTSDSRKAAMVVRDVLSILRSGTTAAYYGPLVQFAAELLHDSTVQLDRVREHLAGRITAAQCWDAAANGGGAVAELVDAAIVMTVQLTAPQMHVHRVWPTVGETVMLIEHLPAVGAMRDADLADYSGTVTELDTATRRVCVNWPMGGPQWHRVDEIAAVRVWRQPR